MSAAHSSAQVTCEMSRPNSYSLQLDGLRGVAIIMVFLHHSGWKLPHQWDWGQMGLRIFFVITGYLITLSIWGLMERVREHDLSHRKELLIYHLRRFARLIPAFYAALFLGYLLGLEDVLEPIWWHVTFLTNFRIAMQGYWMGPTANFWSLSMQEQFYFVWPFFVLWTPRRWFPAMLALLILGAYLYRASLTELGIGEFWRWLMLPGSMDSFAIGAFLAWWKREKGGFAALPESGWRAAALWGFFFIAWCANRIIRFQDWGAWIDALPELFEGVCAGMLLAGCVKGWRGLLGNFFSQPWLGYIGKISYGIFAYHLILLWYFEYHFARFAIGPTRLPMLWSISVFALTLAVAAVSYRFLELPIVRWAKREQKEIGG